MGRPALASITEFCANFILLKQHKCPPLIGSYKARNPVKANDVKPKAKVNTTSIFVFSERLQNSNWRKCKLFKTS